MVAGADEGCDQGVGRGAEVGVRWIHERMGGGSRVAVGATARCTALGHEGRLVRRI